MAKKANGDYHLKQKDEEEKLWVALHENLVRGMGIPTHAIKGPLAWRLRFDIESCEVKQDLDDPGKLVSQWSQEYAGCSREDESHKVCSMIHAI